MTAFTTGCVTPSPMPTCPPATASGVVDEVVNVGGFANIRHGQQLGELQADVDPDSAGAYVIGGLRHGIAQQLRVTPTPDSDQATQKLWRFTAAVLGIT
ncbi:hypothetical protein M2272_000659 [Mycobacterium frederiksbergense]|uniref:Uncharacterized protein n=1 Tax=Mycolicibacterium frederiksbergense TaxID=117567 RepID=A0ABT6KTJ4_9MYCO|nr:TetR family transcriptional regulator [Mycolicibacterium frederiksbergense]MDH6194038.1 hypothetical protein [Mycolicibacterium frederiksbergense]